MDSVILCETMAPVPRIDALWRLVVRTGAALAGCMLVALGTTCYLTYEPAPRIGVLWRAGVSPERRTELERRFLLVERRPEEDRFTYDLLDTSRSNLEALVLDADVADTDRVSRERFEVPFDIPYGTSWMWVAHRLRVLRMPGVVESIVLMCVTVVAAGVVSERRLRARRRNRG